MKTKQLIIGMILTLGLMISLNFKTLAAPIAGDLTVGGTKTNLAAGNYQVVAGTHIFIPAGSAFTFDPGVHIYFENSTYLDTDHNSTLNISDSTAFFFETDAHFWIRGSLFINGTTANPVYFDKSLMLPFQQWNGIIFYHCSNEVVNIQNCYINNAEKLVSPDYHFLSGAIYIDHCNFNAFRIQNTSFKHNIVYNYGGAVFIEASFSADNFTFDNCNFSNNSSNLNGGAITAFSSDTEVLNCNFDSNQSNDGGAVYLGNAAYMRMESSSFNKNSATNSGGGILLQHNINNPANAFLINCDFIENDALLGGGFSSNSFFANLIVEAIDNLFQENTATTTGGGMYIYNDDTSKYHLQQNVFTDNFCSGNGGGLAANNVSAGDYVIGFNSFTYNYAINGGGSSFYGGNIISLDSNEFMGNTAKYYGGAVFGESSFNDLSFTWNSFTGNIAQTNDGGAIAMFNYSLTNPMLVLLNQFDNNSAAYNGGAIASLNEAGGKKYYLNNLITNNTAGNNGGGVFCEHRYSFQNNTIADNTAGVDGGGIYAGINHFGIRHYNNILWNNSPNQGNPIISAMNYRNFKYSDIQGSGPSATNISANPLFVGSGDYHLQTASSCIDSGKPGFSTSAYSSMWTSDVDHDARIITTIDMGVDEMNKGTSFISPKSAEINSEPGIDSPAEFDFDLSPNPASDHLNLRIHGDFNTTQTVNIYDLGGNLIRQFRIETLNSSLPIEQIPNGLYLLQAGEKTKKLSIVH